MAAVEPVRWERLLGIALAASGVTGLVWLVLVCAQFAYAWVNLVSWIRAAMLWADVRSSFAGKRRWRTRPDLAISPA